MIIYVQYECDYDIESDIISIIKDRANILHKEGELYDVHPLFNRSWLISFDSIYENKIDLFENTMRDVLNNGKGRYIIFKIPETKKERSEMILSGWISIDSIEWLNKYTVDKELII